MRLLFLMTILSVTFLQNPVPQQNAKSAQSQHHGSDSAQPSNPGVQVSGVQRAQQNGHIDESAKATTSQQSAPKWWERPTVTDWILAATTLSYVLVNIFMLGSLRSQARIAQQQADNITNSERAWVIVSIERHASGGALYDIVLKNYGNTPARIVEARGDLHQFDKGVSVPDRPSYQADILPAKKLLAPQEEWEIQTFTPHATVRYVQGGAEPLDIEQYFIGYVAYRHIFDREDSPPHYTRFCFRLQGNWTWQAFGPSAYHEYS